MRRQYRPLPRLGRLTCVAVIVAAHLLATLASSVSAATLFSADFEDGDLDGWTVSGRQLDGVNLTETVTRGGSRVAHIQKTSFSEVQLGRTFEYNSKLTFSFDMEVNVTSTGASETYYAAAGAFFIFLDESGGELGYVGYIAATTPYFFTVNASNPIHRAVAVTPGVRSKYSLSVAELLNKIDVVEADVKSVELQFWGYSSTYPYPIVQADVWFDNVVVTDEGGATCESQLAAATVDGDGDGVRDLDDACPATATSTAVDDAGCSREQFCARIDVSSAAGRKLCRRSDWRNDEPFTSKGVDCRVDTTLEKCVPRAEP